MDVAQRETGLDAIRYEVLLHVSERQSVVAAVERFAIFTSA
jgi:hypothetical protein